MITRVVCICNLGYRCTAVPAANALYQGRIIILLSMAKAVVMYGVAGRGWLTFVCITDVWGYLVCICYGGPLGFGGFGRDNATWHDNAACCVSVNIGHFFCYIIVHEIFDGTSKTIIWTYVKIIEKCVFSFNSDHLCA